MESNLHKTPWHDLTLLRVGVMIFSSLVLGVGCYNSGFTTYDDTMHVSQNKQITEMGPLELFKPIPVSTYFPITLLSYQWDRTFFHEGLGWQNWAPGVRLMSWLYHLGAAILIWRFFLRIGIVRNAAYLIALVFAIHPLATETVCWASERKNALAALFGFGALYCWTAAATSRWRMVLVCFFYSLALMSKPSALGFLPIFILVDVCYGPTGKIVDENRLPLKQRILYLFARAVPLVVLSLIALKLNLVGHEATLVEPPGGSVFTAILTDLEIGSRYLFNWIAPVGLSAVYLVEPICGLNDWRVVYFGGVLIAVVGLTFRLAPNRRVLLFSWLWLVGALGTNLNLVAIPHFMQDRYMYLSTPAFFLILWQVLEGVCSRLGPKSASTYRVLGSVYLCVLLGLSAQRSFVWDSTFSIFHDAVEKQPRAAYARFGLGKAYGEASEGESKRLNRDDRVVKKYSRLWTEQWREAMDHCPDVARFSFYSEVALNVGEARYAQNDSESAEKYWMLAAYPPAGTPDQAPARALALGWLASLRMRDGFLEEAHTLAQEAVLLSPAQNTVLLCARTALALAEKEAKAGHVTRVKELRHEARFSLLQIISFTTQCPDAEKLLREIDTMSP